MENGRHGEGKEAPHRPVPWANVRANQPSSSSRLVGAGRGAPGPSLVGRRTWPLSPNGFKDCSDESRPVCCDVLTGTSSRRVQPSELSESRKFCDVIADALRMTAAFTATDVSGIRCRFDNVGQGEAGRGWSRSELRCASVEEYRVLKLCLHYSL